MTRHAPTQADAIVLGAGAAGLMCALTAGQRGRRVVLIDHAAKIGTKILISGGGRCNFTNLEVAPERFISANPHFHKSALKRYTQWDFIRLVERHGIAYHEKTLGQLFCDGSARQILDMLLAECRSGGVELWTGAPVQAVAGGEAFRVTTDRGTATAPKLVIATGGPSIPKTGATGFAYDLARQFGLKVLEPRPGLVPLKLDEAERAIAEPLAGVAIDSVASCGKARFREATLFTHRGVSGPAILQVSNYWTPGGRIALDLLPDLDDPEHLVRRKRERPKAELKTVLAELLPQRLAQRLAESMFRNRPLADTPDKELRKVAQRLKRWEIAPQESEGFAKAEVTLGGIDTAELSQQTMEARRVPGLHVIGEAVDVTGWLGGYNFQWAWSSGWAAGQAL